MLTFKEDGHSYQSIDPNNQIDWISVTSLISAFKAPFDAVKISEKVSRNPNSKWFGLSPERIRSIWSGESIRASEMGSNYHKQRDSDISEVNSIEKDGVTLPVIKSLYDHSSKVKLAPSQTLTEGVYPEHFIYLSSAGLCGQADKVEIIKGTVRISDYKTNKTINANGFKNWEGIISMMQSPLDNLEDCHLIHYALQMSLYMYMILKHNPQLTPGTLTLDHVLFQQEDSDVYGYPIYAKDEQNNFIVKELKQYNIPYYKAEVISLLQYLKDNRDLVKSKLNKK